MSDHPRRPLVLCATARAVEEAERLGFRGCIENAVERALLRGDVIGGTSRDGGTMVTLLREHGVEVVVTRTRSASSGRRAWLPSGVRVLRRERAA
jgi:hypothetical protein